jgi:SAM-dependent methyltransferase
MGLLSKVFKGFGRNNSSRRDTEIIKLLKQLPSGHKILDIGAGEQPYREYCSHLDYNCQDFCQYDGVGDSTGIQTSSFNINDIDIVSDITEIPVENNSYDAILCTEVIEHVPNPIDAVKEMGRILKPGGTIIISSPFFSLSHFAPYHFYSGFNKYFYQHVFNSGFYIKSCVAYGNYFEVIAQELFRCSNPKFISKTTTGRMNVFFRLILLSSIYVLKTINRKDKNSNELLCYGYILSVTKS